MFTLMCGERAYKEIRSKDVTVVLKTEVNNDCSGQGP